MKSLIKKGDKYNITIDNIGSNGEGVGRIEGFTVFVNNGVPGDYLRVSIDLLKKNYAVGSIVDIITPSKDRIKPLCPVAGECGGCQIQHIDYQAQLRLKTDMVRAALTRIGKLDNVPIHDTLGMDDPREYRNKAQFPVSTVDGRSIIGFYKRGSHEIVDTDKCYIQHGINEKIIGIVRKYMEKYKVSSYDEKTCEGLIRHVVTKVGFATGDIMVVIVTNGDKVPHQEKLVEALVMDIPNINIIQNINTMKGNRIMGNECRTLHGKDRIFDYIGSLKFSISPLSFFQVNPMQTKVLYEKALEYAQLTGEEAVYDIYCGIGTISLFLAQRAKRVYGVEIVEAAIEDAKENARINNINNVEFYVGKAEEVFPRLYKQGIKADVVVVDPPRKGCDEKVLDTIVNLKPKRVVYVSCNPATLARDLKYLDERGYRTLEVQPVDMFPHTNHVECVIKIQRVK
jgi:23S rRNA (uracil1939-C5)-methyltransferase